MRLLMYCDAGVNIGLGHLMRTLVLAIKALEHGWEVVISGDLDELAVNIAREMAPSLSIRCLSTQSKTAEFCQLIAEEQPHVVHLDSYDQSLDKLSTEDFILSNMQGGAFGARSADLAIDANLGTEDNFYRPELSRHQLAGTKYALIRSDVLKNHKPTRTQHQPPRVLVVLGGTDPKGFTLRAMDMLELVDSPLSVTVISNAELWEQATERAKKSSHYVEVRSFISDLPSVANEHDLAVTAAGTSVWDFACIGLPMALVCTAENQRRGYNAITNTGLALPLESLNDLKESSLRITHLLQDTEELDKASAQLRKLVDGKGAERVFQTWITLLESR